LNSI
jgi:hypothetical protein